MFDEEYFPWMKGGRGKPPPTIVKPPIGNIIKGRVTWKRIIFILHTKNNSHAHVEAK